MFDIGRTKSMGEFAVSFVRAANKLFCAMCLIYSTGALSADPEWVFGVNKDPITDEATYYAVNDGIFMFCGMYDGRRRTGVTLSLAVDPKKRIERKEVTVTTRFDDKPPVTSDKWRVFTEDDSYQLVVPRGAETDWVRDIFTSSSLFVRAGESLGVGFGKGDVRLDLTGAEYVDVVTFANHCGVQLYESSAVQRAKEGVPNDVLNTLLRMGPQTTVCKKEAFAHLGLLDESDFHEDKDVRFYNAVKMYIKQYPQHCEDREQNGMESWCVDNLTEDKTATRSDKAWAALIDTYSINEHFNERSEEFLERCGNIFIGQ